MARAKGRAGKPKDRLVLDTSITMAWSFEDESDPSADSVLDELATTRALVPSLWPLEVANALLLGERRRRSTEAETIKWAGILRALPTRIDDETNVNAWGDTLNLARGHGLTAYDASYLELAILRGLPFATLDDKLIAAAKAIGISLYDPAGGAS